MLNAEEVNKIKEDLQVVLDKEEEDDALEIMDRLDKELVYNKELLKETKIGVFLSEIGKNNKNKEISTKAKRLVKKWKYQYEEEKGKNQPKKINNDNKSTVSSLTNNKSINNKKLLKRSHSEHESTGSPTDTTPSPTNSSSNTAEIKILKKARTAVTNSSSKHKDNVVTTNKIITKTTATIVTKQTKRNISQSESSGSSVDVDSPTSTTDDTNVIKKARNNTTRSTPTKTSSTDTSLPPSTTASEERKFEIEIDNYEGSGDKTRNTCVGLLYNALAFDSTASSEILLNRSERIESIVLKQNNGNPAKEYRDKLRGLILNLKAKNNPKLRHGVVDGTITAERFCTMSKEEMASEEMRARDRAIQNNNHLKARGAAPPKSETNMFRCGKCGKRETTYYQMQTRSADEPMTTFVTCVVCNNRWKFC